MVKRKLNSNEEDDDRTKTEKTSKLSFEVFDPTRLLGRPVAWHWQARRPSLRDWAGRRGRRPPAPTSLTVSLCH
eukprot:6194481-Pleurochrysis_carterae.AAC.2